jgi:Domain of unknown function (DUF4372)/Transposase DDE domain
MNVGKTLFAQVVEYVPWKTFARIIERHGGDAGVRTLGCADLFRVMVFSQLTWRESLRDIEVCLAANQGKLFHMGLSGVPARSTLSDALNGRDWRIYHALAMRLIAHARGLYAKEPMGVELEATVYALDATTIDLCLSLFDWAPFRSTKAVVKMHTLLDLRGAVPAFIHISDGKMGDVNVLDILAIEAGAFYVMDRGYLDFTRLYTLHQAGRLLRDPSQTRYERQTRVLDQDRQSQRCDLRSAHRFERLLRSQELSRALATHPFQRSAIGQDAGFLDQQHRLVAVDHRRVVQEPLAGRAVLQMDQAAPAHQALFGHERERGEDANLVRRVYLRAHRHC